MKTWTIENEFQLNSFYQVMKDRLERKHKIALQFVDENRTLAQNDMLHELIAEIAQQKGDETEKELKRYIKLTMAVPILRANSQRFRETYDTCIKGLNYEDKLLAMDLIPVSSLLSKEQFSQLLDEVIQHYQAQGITL